MNIEHMKRIVTFGEILLRLSKDGRRRLSQGNVLRGDYGGSEANVAVSLAMLGNEVEYVTRVPDNPVGRASCMTLAAYGIHLDHVCRGGERMGSYFFEDAASLRNSCVVYDRRDSSFYSIEPGMIPWRDIFRHADVFHCSGITCSLSQSAADATIEAVRIAEEMGLVVSCDINYRKNLWNYGKEAGEVLRELASHADIIFGDQGEYEVVSGLNRVPFKALSAGCDIDTTLFEEYMRKVGEKLPKCRKMVMAARNQITSSHHTQTGFLLGDGRFFSSRICDINPVVDPMGVGDAFVAAYLHSWCRWGDDNQRCLDFSLTASALKNSIEGDFNIVSEDEVMALLPQCTAP